MNNSKKLEILLTAKDNASKKLGLLGASFGNLASKAARATKLMAAAGAAAAAAFSYKSIQAAIDLSESVNAVEKTFGEASERIFEFGKTADATAGLSKAAFNSAVVPIGAMLQNMGIEANKAADETINLGKRAADLSSVFNVDLNEALVALQSGLRGESEPLKRFGIDLSQTEVKAYALEKGIAAAGEEMDNTSLATARLGAFFEQTDKFAGDFVDTSDQAANRQRILEARFTNLSATIGEKLMPAWEKLLEVGEYFVERIMPNISRLIDNVAGKFKEWQPRIQEVIKSVTEVAIKIGEFLGPKLVALFNTITRDLIPAFANLWKNYIEPLIPIIGTVLVVAIGAATDALNIIITAVSWLIDAIGNGNPIIWAMIYAFGALKAAMAMKAVFAAITAGFTTMTTVTIPGAMAKMAALRLAVTSPMALAVVGVGAAVAALSWLKSEADKTRAAVQAAINKHQEEASISSIVQQNGGFGGQSTRGLTITGGNGLSQLSFSELRGQRAHGGGVESGREYMTGERGPELFVPSQKGSIVKNMDAQRMMGSTTEISGTINIYPQTEAAGRGVFEALDRSGKLNSMGLTGLRT